MRDIYSLVIILCNLDENDWSSLILIEREREKESGNRSLEKGKKGEVQLVLLLFLLVGRNANVCPPFTYKGAPKGMNSILQNRTFYFGEPPYFHFF
jgi:hypothetical protein